MKEVEGRAAGSSRSPLPCQRCGGTRPWKHRYCHDCKPLVEAEKVAAKRKPCRSCGKDKEPEVGTSAHCLACQQIARPAWIAAKNERNKFKANEARRAQGVPVRRRTQVYGDGTKDCSSCGERKKVEFFDQRRGKLQGYMAKCRACESNHQLESRLASKYGITLTQYDMLLEAQEDRCAICRRKPRSKRLAVDHNHKTGEVRGLLCMTCNHRLLGAAMENPTILRRAADYLDDPPARGMW